MSLSLFASNFLDAEIFYCIIETLDQGRLYPNLEVPGLTCRQKSNPGEHQRKEPSRQLINSYSEHLHMSALTVENACYVAPPTVHVLHEHT